MRTKLISASAVLATCIVAGTASVAALPAGAAAAPAPRLVAPGTWTGMPVPNPNPSNLNQLNAVSCVGPSFCLAMGDSSNFVTSDAQIADLWNGATWSPVTDLADPAGATDVFVGGVSCLSPSWCVAVGASWATRTRA